LFTPRRINKIKHNALLLSALAVSVRRQAAIFCLFDLTSHSQAELFFKLLFQKQYCLQLTLFTTMETLWWESLTDNVRDLITDA
jgi:hypothetical protein